jgi:peptidylprolyl isomerase
LLFLGAAIGLALAAFGLLEIPSESSRLPADAAAQVGERTIRRIDYERVLAGVEGDRRNPVDDATRRRVLTRMIDEELLVQRALELGLAAIDRRVRGELTSGLIASIVGEADADPPSDREVVAHFEKNVDFFSRSGRLHARTIFFSARSDGHRQDGSAEQRAKSAVIRLRRGEDAKDVEAALGDAQISQLPDGMLPTAKVRDYVGPILLKALEAQASGQWSEPIESGSGFYLAKVIARQARVVPRFEEVAALVRQDLKRRRGDVALRRYLDDLRTQKSVIIDESLFPD